MSAPIDVKCDRNDESEKLFNSVVEGLLSSIASWFVARFIPDDGVRPEGG